MQFQTSIPTNPAYGIPNFLPQSNPINNPIPHSRLEPQVNNYIGGSPTFYFKERKGRLDWRNLQSIDLNDLRSGANTSVLEACLGNIAFAALNKEDCERFEDPNLLKMFRLSQYGLEYLLNYQNFLFGQTQDLDTLYKQAQENMTPLAKKARENQDEIQRLKQQVRHQKKVVATYENALKTPIFKCQLCKKCFKSKGYLADHIERRHTSSSTAKQSTNIIKIVTKDTSTSPLGLKQKNNLTPTKSAVRYQENYDDSKEELEASTKPLKHKERDVLVEKNTLEDKNRNTEDEALEKMRDMLQTLRDEDNQKISQIGEMMQQRLQELLRTNSDIGQRVRQLEQKVDTQHLTSSLLHRNDVIQEEDEHDKENRHMFTNNSDVSEKKILDPEKIPSQKDETLLENKLSNKKSTQQLPAEEDLNYINVEEHEKEKVSNAKDINVKEQENSLSMRKNSDSEENIVVEDFGNEENLGNHSQRETERNSQGMMEMNSKELIRKEKEATKEIQRNEDNKLSREEVLKHKREEKIDQVFHKQIFRAGEVEDDKIYIFKPAKETIFVVRAGPLEDDKNSDEEIENQVQAGLAKLEKYQKDKTHKDRRIEEVGEIDEEEPEYEDEDERERTMRIIESSMGLRGDEDKLVEKDRKAYLKAKQTMSSKYLKDQMEKEQLKEAEEEIKIDVKNSFKTLFGDDYESLAGKDVLNLEEILGSLQTLNQKQKERFSKMKEDYSTIQRKKIFSSTDQMTFRETHVDDDIKIKRYNREEEGSAAERIQKAKASLAEFEQIIKESQESSMSVLQDL